MEVLQVSGAGLSVLRALGTPRALRVPLGASDEVAECVERLQTTLGEGPCLTATDQGGPLVADSEAMASRWPLFYAELLLQTPIRSVASFPVLWGMPPEPAAALDLYFVDDLDESIPPLELITREIVAIMAEMLFASPGVVEQRGVWLPTWMTGRTATRRMNVWVAVGMVVEHAELSSDDALAVLRAYAFGRSLTLDDLAESMADRRVNAATVVGSSDE